MSANKWVGGTLIVLGGLTDLGALAGANRNVAGAPTETASLVVGTASLAGGLWLWNEKPGRGRTRHSAPRRYTGRPR